MLFPIIEGFDHYAALTGGVNGALDTEWNIVTGSPAALVTGLGGDGKAISWSFGVSVGHMIKAFAPDSKITFHFAIEITTLDSASLAEFISFQTVGGSHQFGLLLNPAGNIQLLGEGGAQVAISAAALQPNQIYRICCQADIANGTFAASINGDVDAGLTHVGLDINDDPLVNTAGIIVVGMMSDGFGGRHNAYILDDLVVGTGALADWGPVEVNTLPADGDVAVQFARSAGVSNFGNVDDIPFTADTDYNSSGTVGDKDCFSYANPPHTPDSIIAVALMTMARKEESATRKFREFLRIGGVDYPGTEHSLAESYGRWFSSWGATNPATAAPWTALEINALQGGYELTVVD